jgi:hypothetical protein
LLAAGVALPVLHLLMRPPIWGGALAIGVGAAGILFLLALTCFALAWQNLPEGSRLGTYDEELFWGGGHLLQFVHTALLLTAWQMLGEQAFGRLVLGLKPWAAVCGLLVLAGLPGPLLYLMLLDGESLRAAFTRLYWIGLPLPPLIMGLALADAIRRGPRNWNSPAFLALVGSLALFAVGGVLGAFATGADTRTPAHYHAEIGGVNLAFMGLFFAILLPVLLRGGTVTRAVRLQFWLYGGGQALFSLGMFIAGSEGVARKVAGADQGLDSAVKLLGMGMTGLGGLVAVCGGVMFVWLALRRLAVRGPR